MPFHRTGGQHAGRCAAPGIGNSMRGLPRARGAIIARPSPAATCLPRETRFGSPRGGAPGEINEFCVACHRFPGQNFAVNWNAQWNVRRQPPYLQRSRCFLESQGRLTCFSCRNPHAALQKGDAGYYTRKCLECHSKDGHQPAAACRRQTSGGCVG